MIRVRVRYCHIMGESESEIPSALALEYSGSEEDCTPLTISAQCVEVERGAKSEPGKMNEVMCGPCYSSG